MKREKRTALVLTTINVPCALEKYIENCKAYGHNNVFFVVVGDMKSPPETTPYLLSLKSLGYDIVYLSVEKQRDWLLKYPDFSNFLPYNSVQRRNIGYLCAYEMNADLIVSIDDDNIPLPHYDYVGEHTIVGDTITCDFVRSSSGWFNSCSLLQSEPPRSFYHRGYPVSKRWLPDKISYVKGKGRVVVNVGLWIGDPDVDTITRMEEPFRVTAVKEVNSRICLAADTIAPFNSQNTAFLAELLPCIYLISFKSGTAAEIFRGNNNFRYDDIWMSYFAKIVIDRMGDAVCIGPPYVEQIRNKHDYLLDLRKEICPMEMTNKMADLLSSIQLTEKSYLGCYKELIGHLRTKVATHTSFSSNEQDLLNAMINGMLLWIDVVSKITRES